MAKLRYTRLIVYLPYNNYMKRLFFQIVLSVMITACHEVNEKQTNKEATIAEPPSSDCLNDKPANHLDLNNIPVESCPVN